MDPNNQNPLYSMYSYQQASGDASGYAGPSSGRLGLSYNPGFSPEIKLVLPPTLSPDDGDGFGEEDADGDGEEETTAREDNRVKRSQSMESLRSWERDGGSPKKKPRVTLARGGACVACR